MLLGIGMAAGTSRELNRNRELIPVSKHYGGIFRIVFGKAMVYFMVYAVLGMYLTLVVPKLFGFVSMVTWTTILGFLLPYILSCIFFGLMLSCLVRYRENVMLLVVFTSVPLLFMTGISYYRAISRAFGKDLLGFSHLLSASADSSESAVWEHLLLIFFRNSGRSGYRRASISWLPAWFSGSN